MNIDLTYYTGKDLYTDGAVEDELLELVKNNRSGYFEGYIHDKPSWAYIYHLSDLRGNVVEWLPMDKSMSVLEIGSGCGAVTGTLAGKCGHVTCIELSKKRSMINAERNRDLDNVDILVGNYQDIEKHLEEKYDIITLIGVLEYAGSFFDSADPYGDLLASAKSHLKENGRIIIAIENRYGLKYWAGAKEDHTGIFFDGLEGYPGNKSIRTFSNKELRELAKSAGFENNRFFYPYPDYKLPLMIFSDARLPKPGELINNIKNYDTERMGLFDEGAVFDGIIDNDNFPFFSNSFVCILSDREEIFGYPDFVKYNSRSPRHNIKTAIVERDGVKVVTKSPKKEEAAGQIRRIRRAYDLLCEAYDKDSLRINRFTENGETLEFDFIEGRSYASIIDEILAKEGYEGVLREVKKYAELVRGRHGTIPFRKTEMFIMVFGNVDIFGDVQALPVANVDMLFENIIVNDGMNLIDYEWTFDFPIPVNYVIYRALMVYINFTPERRKLYARGIFADLGITDRELSSFHSMDEHFYEYALGEDNGYVSALRDIVDMRASYDRTVRDEYARVYFDRGSGFCEADSFLVIRHEDRGGCLVEFNIPKGVKAVRIDPVEKPCIISNILALTASGYSMDYTLNGAELKDGRWIFTGDPQIIFSCVTGRFKLYMTIAHHGDPIFKVLLDTGKEKDASVAKYNELVAAVNTRVSIPRRAIRKIKRSFLGVFDRPGGGGDHVDETIESIRKYNIAVIVDASRIDEERLKFTMYSLTCQTYRPYDIRFFGGSYEPDGVPARINDYIKSSNADYYVFLRCGDALSNDALYSINEYISNNGSSAIYADEKRFNLSIGDGHESIYKPDYAIDTLRSQNYIGTFGAFSAALLEDFDGINEDLSDAYIYDLFLKAWDKEDVGHISGAIHYARYDGVRNYEEEFKALCSHVEACGLVGKYVMTDIPGIFKPALEIEGQPLISLIIPNKDGADLLRKCIESMDRGTYRNYEIIILENNSLTNEIFDYYEELKKRDKVSVVTWTKGWNYAAINNYGASLAKGEYLLLLNNDIEVISPDWIEEMLMFAQRPDVGAVGVKLYYPNGTIQHAGVTVGVRGVAGHAFNGHERKYPGYMNRAVSVQELSSVTAACMMIRRDAFEKVRGFNEAYAVAFNDVDLCLRLGKAGYKVIFTPYCECYHHESVTRGADTESKEKMERFAGEVNRFNEDWVGFLAKGDPFYNKNLSLDNDEFEEAEYRGI